MKAVLPRTLIRERRRAALPQRQLADVMGVPQSTLARIESGQRAPTFISRRKIKKALRDRARGSVFTFYVA